MANPRERRDHERLRQALQRSTSTEHKAVLVPTPGKQENQETRLARRAVVPTGRKMNDSNNAHAKKAANISPPKVTAATLLASGISKKVTEGFGIPPIQLI